MRHLNVVRVVECPPTADALVALADRWLQDPAAHHVCIEDGAAGERLADDLENLGFLRRRAVVMALDPAGASAAAVDPRARELDEAAMQALERAVFAEAATGPGRGLEIARQLADAQTACRAGTASRRFGAGTDGELVATAMLFCDPDVDGARVAQLESVATLRPHRERGFAAAAVGAALIAAREWGAELVALVADGDDWPQVWYSRLGFTPVAHHVAYVRDGSGRHGR